ncbi:MmcQ/YjbR family DNA-binding protein [Actinocrinis sp.]|uniref:MmcQ/YjbR family DNA-binding protein n=1 Tax=Actinocrinis sp. TaxID=1920516 RepID=UPI002D463AFA|nr:MmcQ/YjbR family DNA-binding protein [Actinocrinis sp.]HZP50624.1 MmcQ/YjbR family DNA-binding protein [Actinocrinis sp.]
MATWEDVRRLALALPETFERTTHGTLDWRVRDKRADKSFAWERPLRRADLEALGAAAPRGPILGVRVPDLAAKEALLASDPDVCFTTPHFDGHASVLVRLGPIDVENLRELLIEAWLCRAPKDLVQAYLGTPP